MTVTATTPASGPPAAPRLNGYGRPCPPWCQTSHSQERSTCVAHQGSFGNVWICATLGHAGAAVAFSGSLDDANAHWPSMHLNPAEAEDMATLAGLLAELTPDQHHALAAAIRQGAAQITGATDG